MKEFVDFCAKRGHVIPAELIEDFDKDITYGDLVKVTHSQFGHEFEIGDIVKVISISSGGDSFRCTNGSHDWWLSRSEFVKT